MTRLAMTPVADFQAWEAGVKASVRAAGSLAEAAQRCVGLIYDQFRESVVLARFYAILPWGRLPPEERRFANDVAGARGAKVPLEEATRVLVLLGTRGEQSAWNERRASRGHLAIPLISAAFVEEIPMVARMLKELGLPIEWVTGTSKAVAIDTFGKLGGFFYVEDAESAVDNAGRKIISAQDFVQSYRIKTVFGTAGMYVRSRMLVTLIVFCREQLERDALKQRFMPLGNVFTNATSEIVRQERIFAS